MMNNIAPLDEIDALMLEIQLLRGIAGNTKKLISLLNKLSTLTTNTEYARFVHRAEIGNWSDAEYKELAA